MTRIEHGGYLEQLPRGVLGISFALLAAATVAITSLFAAAPTWASAQSADGCAAPAYAPGTTQGTITSGGIARDFIVYIPDTLDLNMPAPLVFTLHGFAGNAAQQQTYSGWDAAADAHGLIAVYPQGTGFPRRWHSGTLFQNRDAVDDVAFMRDLVAHLERSLCIDPARVFVNGLSNGGGMSYRLACEASDVFAAWGGVAGAYSTNASACQPTRPLPAMLFHGTGDPIVPYTGQRDSLPDIQSFISQRAAANGCQTEIEAAISDSVDSFTYGGCTPDSAEVMFYRIANGGHTWPGAASEYSFLGETTQDIDATTRMAAFFLAHPMP